MIYFSELIKFSSKTIAPSDNNIAASSFQNDGCLNCRTKEKDRAWIEKSKKYIGYESGQLKVIEIIGIKNIVVVDGFLQNVYVNVEIL